MASITIGILSDTHLDSPTAGFVKAVHHCFADASVIFHAGDLTDPSVLRVFQGKEVHAVQGNMCILPPGEELPLAKKVRIGPFLLAITHGMQYRMKSPDYIEEQLLLDFPDAHCIIYGHTHQPSCRTIGHQLVINPGSFRSTGRHGAPGTYAIIEATDTLRASLRQAPHWS